MEELSDLTPGRSRALAVTCIGNCHAASRAITVVKPWSIHAIKVDLTLVISEPR